jgi:hypothetical protein
MAGLAPGEEGLDMCEDLTFHGIDYIVTISVAESSTLVVDVEQVGTLFCFFRSMVDLKRVTSFSLQCMLAITALP